MDAALGLLIRTNTTSPPSPTLAPSLPSPILDHPDVDNGNCRLLGPFALVVQGLMGILVLGTLVWKRQRERPRRPWKIWILDITKQMLGQLFVHILNVALSTLVAHVGEENPCSLYFLNILIDTTLGVFIIYLTLRITTHVLTDLWGLPGFVSGRYSDRTTKRGGVGSGSRLKKTARPKLGYWVRQLGMYFFALLVMKVIVTILFVLFPFLFTLGRWILGLFGEAKNVQVLFVMCLFPLAMNTLQFWLVDSFLRHDPNKSKYASHRNGQGDDEGVQSANSSGIPAWGFSSTSTNGGGDDSYGGDLPYHGRGGDDDDSHSYLVEDLSEDDGDESEDEEDTGTRRRRKATSPTGSQQHQQLNLDDDPPKPRLRSAPLSRTASPLGLSSGSDGGPHTYPPSDGASVTAIDEREVVSGRSRSSNSSRGGSRVNSPAEGGNVKSVR